MSRKKNGISCHNLILDEPSSTLDVQTGYDVFTRFRSLSESNNERDIEKGRTTMQENTRNLANEMLIQEYLEIATVTDDMDHFSELITEDCVWVMMPTGHAFKGFEQVTSLAKMAGSTRVHDEKYKVKILNWFTDSEHFCVEYHHGAIIKGLRIKGL